MIPAITSKATHSEAVNNDKQKLEGRKVKEIPIFLWSVILLIEMQKTSLDREGEYKDHSFLKNLSSRDFKQTVP